MFKNLKLTKRFKNEIFNLNYCYYAKKIRKKLSAIVITNSFKFLIIKYIYI